MPLDRLAPDWGGITLLTPQMEWKFLAYWGDGVFLPLYQAPSQFAPPPFSGQDLCTSAANTQSWSTATRYVLPSSQACYISLSGVLFMVSNVSY